MGSIIPAERIEHYILLIRGHKVMLDSDLAKLYAVPVKVFNQAVKRNRSRFPDDFMFQLTWAEARELPALDVGPRSQIVTLKRGGNIKYRPYVFTEQGVAMLSSVLHSTRAVQVNIEIMRTFVRLRHLLASHAEVARKLEALERKLVEHDKQFAVVFEAIRQLMEPEEPEDPPKERIGYHPHGV
jgi:hypothetical protein